VAKVKEEILPLGLIDKSCRPFINSQVARGKSVVVKFSELLFNFDLDYATDIINVKTKLLFCQY